MTDQLPAVVPPPAEDEPAQDTVVVRALAAEFVRMRNKLNGAAGRLKFAQHQVDSETILIEEHKADLDMLADAILSSGGTIPAEDEDAMTVAARMAS